MINNAKTIPVRKADGMLKFASSLRSCFLPGVDRCNRYSRVTRAQNWGPSDENLR